MMLKSLLVILTLYLILPFASAEGNISIGEIGTIPTVLIDGTNAFFFADIYNSGDTGAEIELEFVLDSASLEKQRAIIESKSSKKITSNSSTVVSLNNRIIEVIVYENNTKVNKSAQLIVNKKESPPEQEKDNFTGYLPIISAIGIFIGIYLFIKTRKTVTEERPVIRKAENPFQEIAKQAVAPVHQNSLSNNLGFFLNNLKTQSEGYGQAEEYKLLMDIIGNIYNMTQNIELNNTEAAKWSLEDAKKRMESLLLMLRKEKVPISSTKPVETEVPKLDKNEIKVELEKQDKLKKKDELEKQRDEVNRKKQFVDVLIPEFLLKIAEDRIHQGEIKAAEGLIFAAEMMLENDEVLQRLRKLREIGF